MRKKLMAWLLCAAVLTAMLPVTAQAAGEDYRYFVYAANYNDNTISAYLADPDTGVLTQLPNSPCEAGQYPSSVTAAADGKHIYVTNEGGGTVSGYAVDEESGGLTEIPGSPYSTFTVESLPPHPVASAISPDGSRLYVANKDSDSIKVFAIGAGGTLTPQGFMTDFEGTTKSYGNCFVAVHPDGQYLFAANSGSRSISVYDAETFEPVAGSPFETGTHPRSVAVHQEGKLLYAANWGEETITGYWINEYSGALSPVDESPFDTTGDDPIALLILGDTLYAANGASKNIAVYDIDTDTGELTEIPGSPFSTGNWPSALASNPVGDFLYVAHSLTGSNKNVRGHTIDSSAGAPLEMDESPFDSGTYTMGIAVARVAAGAPSGKIYKITANGQTIAIPAGETATVTCDDEETYTNVQIVCGAGVNLTLKNVNIDDSGNDYTCALSFTDEDNILTLAGANTLISGKSRSGVRVEDETQLTIAGTGELTVTGGLNGSGIGGNNQHSGGIIHITGGTIAASGGDEGAGIGGGQGGHGGTIKISGGTLTANGGYTAAGIGGGCKDSGNGGNGGIIEITGGDIGATGGMGGAGIGGGDMGTGGNVTISGGTIVATGGSEAAGIGGGLGAAGGTIRISGGTVRATGVAAGAGIGGGDYNGANVIISDGDVKATGGQYGAGIGGGESGPGGNIEISGGTVEAAGGQYSAGIGGGGGWLGNGGNGGTVTINGGTVTADGGEYGAGIGGGSNGSKGGNGGNVTINSGTVTATGGWIGGAGIGGGSDGGSGGKVTVNGGVITATGGGAGIGSGWNGVGGEVIITDGDITAKGGGGCAGIGSGTGGKVEISGGAVTAIGKYSGAGISGGTDSTVEISGGTIMAIGGDGAAVSGHGAGIGGCGSTSGIGKDAGTIKITGGTVTAESESGAGIGGGIGGSGNGGAGATVITGGSVKVSGGSCDIQGTPTNGGDKGDAPVFLTTVTLEGISVETAVSGLTASLGGSEYGYGLNDTKTDPSGKLYLYLPEDTATTRAETDSGDKYEGSVPTSTNPETSSGILYLSGAGTMTPTVATEDIIDITPTGALILGEVKDDGGRTVTARGAVYSLSPSPTLETGTAVAASTAGTGEFGAALAGLSPNTGYYVRVYAANGSGTAYGTLRYFTTPLSVTTVPVGAMPKQPAVNRVTNKIYVPNSLGYSVTVLDGAADTVLSTISIGAGTGPYFAAVNETTNKIYVANIYNSTVSVIDGATDTVAATVPVGSDARAIAINETTNMIYVANYGNVANSVTVINGADDTVSATLNVGSGKRPYMLAVNEQTNKLYIADYWSNNIVVADCATCTIDAVVPASVSQNSPRFVAVNETTNKIYAANFRSENVTVIDGSDNSYEYVTVGVDPWEIAINEDTNKIFVSTDGESSVSIIDGSTNGVQKASAGEAPQAVALNTKTNMIYAGNYNSDDRSEAGFVVTQIDGTTLESVGFANASNPSFLAVNSETNKVYVVNFDNTVSIIALEEQISTPAVAGAAADDTAILQIDNKTPSARDKTWEINVTSGTVKAGLAKADVTLSGLPAGLDYTTAKGPGNTIVITLTGAAATALTADATVTATIKGSAVTETGAQDSAGISLKLWYIGEATTLAVTNEAGGLIDKLTDAGHGTKNLYQVTQLLQPYSSGAITDRFIQTLASGPADGEAFTVELSDFSDNYPVCINADGTVSINPAYGQDYDGGEGYTTAASTYTGVGVVRLTTADDAAHLIQAGVMEVGAEGTKYYKAFAIAWMSTGGGGGDPSPVVPTVVTNDASGITASGATLNGNVTASGGATVTERGFVYGASANPAIGGAGVTKVIAGSGTGSFNMAVGGLEASTPYHVRAYAINSQGAACGEDRAFTTRSGGGSDGSAPATPASLTYNAIVTENKVQVETLPVTVVSGSSTGTVRVTEAQAANFLAAGADTVILTPPVPGVSGYNLEIHANSLTQSAGSLIFDTPYGSAAIPGDMLSPLTGTKGQKAGITVGQGDKTGLSSAEKAAIGDRPLIQLTLTLDGVQTDWNNPAAPVTATIPYKPAAEELKNPESLIIWRLDGSGRLTCVPNGHYDAAAGTVTFKITHFSQYAGGYNPVSFKDVTEARWYQKAVSFIAARGITEGMGGGYYSPDAKLTRGEFLVMMMRTYDIAPDANPTGNFTDAGSTWYTNYLAAAKRLGISAGVGGNRFAPEQAITRQEMFTLLYNALNVIGQPPRGASGRTLSDFSDSGRIASWARDAMNRFVETGAVSGDGGGLNPTGGATRAEIAQVLHNLLLQ